MGDFAISRSKHIKAASDIWTVTFVTYTEITNKYIIGFQDIVRIRFPMRKTASHDTHQGIAVRRSKRIHHVVATHSLDKQISDLRFTHAHSDVVDNLVVDGTGLFNRGTYALQFVVGLDAPDMGYHGFGRTLQTR